MTAVPKKITFIGGGNMCWAIVKGLVASRFCPVGHIQVVDRNADKLSRFSAEFGIKQTFKDPAQALPGSDVVVLAVKPQSMAELTTQVKPVLAKLDNVLFVSVMAGLRIDSLQTFLGARYPIVRTMPNTPSAVGQGMTILAANGEATEANKSLVESMFRSIGGTVWAKNEDEFDKYMSVSGCGPAYFFEFMENMIVAATQMGISRKQATEAVLKTAYGAVCLAMESDDTPGTLKQKVRSKGGTTDKALNVFEEAELQTTVFRAMKAAVERAQQMSVELDPTRSLTHDE